MVKNPCSQYRGRGFYSWLGKFPMLCSTAKKKKKKEGGRGGKNKNKNKKSQVSGKANRSYLTGIAD